MTSRNATAFDQSLPSLIEAIMEGGSYSIDDDERHTAIADIASQCCVAFVKLLDQFRTTLPGLSMLSLSFRDDVERSILSPPDALTRALQLVGDVYRRLLKECSRLEDWVDKLIAINDVCKDRSPVLRDSGSYIPDFVHLLKQLHRDLLVCKCILSTTQYPTTREARR